MEEMYVRCRLDKSRNRIESRYPHVVAKAEAQPTREPILKENREVKECRECREHIYTLPLCLNN